MNEYKLNKQEVINLKYFKLRNKRSKRVKPVLDEYDFTKRVTAILGLKGRKNQVREIFSAKTHKGLRINPLLVNTAADVKKIRDELIKQGIDAVHLTWYPDGFIIPAKDIPAVMTLPMSKNGLVFVQNPSSFLPILALDPQPGEKYLDVCSAPGGKAVFYAGLTRGKSLLYLVDDNYFRVSKKMRAVLESQKVTPEEIIICDAKNLIKQKKIKVNSFDKVLVDADCSSEGKINFKSKNPLKQWVTKSANQFSHQQLEILSIGYEALKPGGILVYSTCTLSPEENEGVISRFLKKFPDAILQKLIFDGQKTYKPIINWPGQQILPDVKKTLRIDPRDQYMEGFFVCRIIKSLIINESKEGLINKQKNNNFVNEVVNLDKLGKKFSLLKNI